MEIWGSRGNGSLSGSFPEQRSVCPCCPGPCPAPIVLFQLSTSSCVLADGCGILLLFLPLVGAGKHLKRCRRQRSLQRWRHVAGRELGLAGVENATALSQVWNGPVLILTAGCTAPQSSRL